MKISKAETRLLVKHMKELVEQDIVGITSADARNTICDWLTDVGQPQASGTVSGQVTKYMLSPKIDKLRTKYEKEY